MITCAASTISSSLFSNSKIFYRSHNCPVTSFYIRDQSSPVGNATSRSRVTCLLLIITCPFTISSPSNEHHRVPTVSSNNEGLVVGRKVIISPNLSSKISVVLLLGAAVSVTCQSQEVLERLPGYHQWREHLLRHRHLQERHLQLLESAQEDVSQDENTEDVINHQINTKEGLKEILKQVLINRLAEQSIAERSRSESFLDNLNSVLDANENFDIQGESLHIAFINLLLKKWTCWT